MEIRWSPEAAADFSAIIEYIRKENRSAAERVARVIFGTSESLARFSQRGRSGRVEGTRELVLVPLPFVLIYRVKSDFVEIVRVLHGSQRWP